MHEAPDSDDDGAVVDISGNVTAVAALVTSLATLVATLRTHREVKTANGLSIGKLTERAEGRRILADVLPADRTKSEQGYVEQLDVDGRDAGHEGEPPGPVQPK